MKNILLVVLLAGWITNSLAQNSELFHLKYSVSPLDGSRSALQSLETNVKVPVMIGDKEQLIGSLGYDALWSTDSSLAGTNPLHSVALQFFLNKKLNEKKSMLFFLMGGLHSDFEEISTEDIRFSTGVRYNIELSNSNDISLGIIYSRQFFGNLIAPFIDFDLKLANRLSFSGPFPLSPGLKYNAGNRTMISLFLKPDNASYRLSEMEHESRYLQKRQWNVGFGVSYAITKHWSAVIKIGSSLNRRIEIYDASQKGVFSIFTIDVSKIERNPITSLNEDALFGEVIIAWSFPSLY